MPLTFSCSNRDDAESRPLFPPATPKCDHGSTALKVAGSLSMKSGLMKICNTHTHTKHGMRDETRRDRPNRSMSHVSYLRDLLELLFGFICGET